MPDEILTLPEVAQLLKVAEKTVYTMAQRQEIPAFKVRGQWRFKRADGAPWSLAGLWNVWTDKATGETHESYTMILGGSHVT